MFNPTVSPLAADMCDRWLRIAHNLQERIYRATDSAERDYLRARLLRAIRIRCNAVLEER